MFGIMPIGLTILLRYAKNSNRPSYFFYFLEVKLFSVTSDFYHIYD